MAIAIIVGIVAAGMMLLIGPTGIIVLGILLAMAGISCFKD